MAINLEDTNIDPNQKKYRNLLKNLQGNILKGHGRDYTRHIFLSFREGSAQAARRFIREFAKRVTSAREQLAERRRFKITNERADASTFSSFLLSAQGFRFFGFPNDRIPRDQKFRAGLEASAQALGDNPAEWQPEYRGQRIHAMILLASDKPAKLNAEVKKLRTAVANVARILRIEKGKAIWNKDRNPIEHFGYVDGISQPLFIKGDVERERSRSPQYDPSAPLKLVLTKDLNASKPDSYGSYLVYQKIEQDVKAFRQKEARLRKKLQLSFKDRKRAGAMIVGRFPDGTALTLHSAEGMRKPIDNDFDYGQDDQGNKCPFHAHIRKMNTRRRDGNERVHRIARRGITYGNRKRGLTDSPANEVGLLFMCFQSNIGRQFEWLQRIAANNRAFERPATGLDPSIGQGRSIAQNWPVKWNEKEKKKLDIHGLVQVRGGEYFFAPSIGFLRNFR